MSFRQQLRVTGEREMCRECFVSGCRERSVCPWPSGPLPQQEQVLAEVRGLGVGLWAVTCGTRMELPRLSSCGREDTHVTRLETAPCPPPLCSVNTAPRVETITQLFRDGQPPALGSGS